MPASDAPPGPVRLHDYFRSSAAYRIRIALNLKGVAYESVGHDLRTGEQRDPDYLALNPQGLIPMLEIDGLRLNQSLAIVDYLDARFPEPRFVPKDPAHRSHVLAMALVIACDIHPLNNLRVLGYLRDRFGQEQPAIDGWYAHWLTEGLAALEVMAAEHARDWLSGDEPGIADLCLVPQMYNARRFAVPIEGYPTLLGIDATLQALEPVARAHPDLQG